MFGQSVSGLILKQLEFCDNYKPCSTSNIFIVAMTKLFLNTGVRSHFSNDTLDVHAMRDAFARPVGCSLSLFQNRVKHYLFEFF